jgi:hypothetical protein
MNQREDLQRTLSEICILFRYHSLTYSRERMSTIGHRLSLIHEDTYEAAGVPIMSVIFRPPNGIDRASAHM